MRTPGLTLVVGAGISPVVPNVIQHDISDYPNIDVISDTLPFKAESFDSVFCENVIEHVPDPYKLVADITRILKAGGILGINGTNLHFTHGFPSHYFNPTEFGMRRLLDQEFEGEYNFVDPMGSMFTVMNYNMIALEPNARNIIEAMTVKDLLQGMTNRDENLHTLMCSVSDVARRAISTNIYFLGRKV